MTCNLEVQCRIHNSSPITPILSRINLIPRIDTYFLKVHSNISSHLHLGLHKDLSGIYNILNFQTFYTTAEESFDQEIDRNRGRASHTVH